MITNKYKNYVYRMLSKNDKFLLESLVKDYSKDEIITALNEGEDRRGVIESEYHVTFSIDCEELSYDVEDLYIELNSQVGDLPFMIDTQYGLNNVLITIGFNDDREAALINSLVCDLMFRGSVDDYCKSAEELFLGNVEALGLPLTANVNEAVFTSLKNKTSDEEKKDRLKKETSKLIYDDIKVEMEKYIVERLKTDKDVVTDILLDDFDSPWGNNADHYFAPYDSVASSLHCDSPVRSGKKSVEVFTKPHENRCTVVIFISSTSSSYGSINVYHIDSDTLFDYIDSLEADLIKEFGVTTDIKLRFFAGGREHVMMDTGMSIILGAKVTGKKFIKFINRFLAVNSKRVRSDSWNAPVISINKKLLNTVEEPPKEYTWAKSFQIQGKDIKCAAGPTAFNLLLNS